jgi:hypothetical protein
LIDKPASLSLDGIPIAQRGSVTKAYPWPPATDKPNSQVRLFAPAKTLASFVAAL